MNSRKKRFWKVWETKNAQLADRDVDEANRIRDTKFSITHKRMKEVSLKELEDIAREVMPEYPKYLGHGLWKISEGCITNERGVEQIMNITKNQPDADKN